MKQKGKFQILDVEKVIMAKRSGLLFLVDRLGWVLTHPYFFCLLAALLAGWIVFNLPLFAEYKPIDPDPFAFLATVASVEAPFLSLLIIIYQRRNSRTSDLRAETHLKITLYVEREASMALRMIDEIQRNLKIASAESDGMKEELKSELQPR